MSKTDMYHYSIQTYDLHLQANHLDHNMKTTIEIQNLKCSGCEATIINKLSELKNIKEILVNHENGSVNFKYNTPEDLEITKKTLSKLGYPQVGEQNKFPTKAKSYVSCAIGRINKS